ncbi:MAG: hypothetical protein J2P21_25620 [Chloracidobacterium sp.]|nr:hypothetical protein [Chloracidobacterium sp.]
MENQAEDLKKRIDDLNEKITQRVKDYGLRLEDMGNFVNEIDVSNEMWKQLQPTKIEIEKTMDGLIMGSPAPVQTAPQ